MNALDGKDVLLVFPTNHKKNSTVRILKTPKTESSVRKIFLPKSVASEKTIRNDIRNKYRNNNTNKASNESINESLNSNSW